MASSVDGCRRYTRRSVGAGTASYLATRPDDEGLLAVIDDARTRLAGIAPMRQGRARAGDRRGGSATAARYLFADQPRRDRAAHRDRVRGRRPLTGAGGG